MIATDISPDTRALADKLAEVPRGERISLKALTAVISRNIVEHRHLLYSAFRIVERETGAVFACERGSGYRRLTPEEIPSLGSTARSRVRHIARRGRKSIAAGIEGANDMPDNARRRALQEMSALGVLEHVSRDKSLPDIKEDASSPLPVAAAAKAFLKKIGAIQIE